MVSNGMDSIAQVPAPRNEPPNSYAPGSPERARLKSKLKELQAQSVDLPMIIGGRDRHGTGERIAVVEPHNHRSVLGHITNATHADATAALEAARAAAPEWRRLPYEARAAIILRAADLASGPWRETLAAATMLGQSKSILQAEIDAPCELVDFWRFNVAFGRDILSLQPESTPGFWNRLDHRPLEGFVYAITPFNFTAIAANLPTAPMLMGNVVIWKPSPTQSLSAFLTMRLLEEAGLPPGVLNLVTGDGGDLSEVLLTAPDLAGIHFTGSTKTFRHLWHEVGLNLSRYRSYPRLVGETGGKDFIVAHESADPAALQTAMIRGAFEFQGQKCSAASRAYIPLSLWNKMRDSLLAETESITYGDVSDLRHFGGAIIDRRGFAKNVAALERAEASPTVLVHGGKYDDSDGYFVWPTILVSEDARDECFSTEYFGPILSVYVYDEPYADILTEVDRAAPYALTGSIFARDRAAIEQAADALRYTAGNFYINDKPTGAVVGQQPFGGSRASGTNDKAGSPLNLLRWVSPRTIKETFIPPTDHRYPHMRES